MSLFFRQPTEQRSDEGWVDFGHGGPTVTYSRMTRLIPAFSAIRHIVDYAATTPIDHYRESGDGVSIPASRPEMFRKLDNPGNIGVGSWIGQAAYGLAADGNAVAYMPKPDLAVWLHRDFWSFDEYSKRWYVEGREVPRDSILHIPWIVPAGRVLGMAPFEHFAATISAGLSAQEYADMKRGGGLPPTTLKNLTQTIDPEAAKSIGSRLAKRFADGEPFVYGRDWEFGVTQIPPNHAQFIETMKLTANQIAAAYGLDPVEVGGESANSQEYSNEEMRQIKRAANMRPYLSRIEHGISRYLPGRQTISFNIDANLRSDAKTRTEVLGLQVADGRLSVNEARVIEKRPPVKGGDVYNLASNNPAPALPTAKEKP